jgi:hypothetical protein
MAPLSIQLAWLLFLAMPVACVACTFTPEELFKELHDLCVRKSEKSRHLYQRKFFFLLTCEYCFSHYVTVGFLALTGFHLLLPDWRGLVIAGFALVWMANIYMGIFGRLRLGIKSDRVDIEMKEKVLDKT